MRGISLRHTTHEVDQKFTSSTLPRSSEVASASPDRVANLTCGAASGRSMAAAPAAIATTASATISLAFMRTAIVACFCAALVTCAPPGLAQLEGITSKEAASALRAALEKGSQAAVASLGRTDGFFGNARVKIPLPDSLQRTERAMRRFGMGRYADELVLTMNRAAEAAVPEARQLFVDSVRKMSVQDAKGILQGGDSAGTAYFRRSTEAQLRKRFLPIVRQATAKVGLAQRYNVYAERGVAFGLVKKEHANLDDYVTQKALDGLFVMVAEEEKKIRKDPVGSASAIIRKVFGAIL